VLPQAEVKGSVREVSFPSVPLEAALSISNFSLFLIKKQFFLNKIIRNKYRHQYQITGFLKMSIM